MDIEKNEVNLEKYQHIPENWDYIVSDDRSKTE